MKSPRVSNCFYDKLRILHDLCRVVWFIRKHGLSDAQREGSQYCRALFDKIAQELEEHIHELKETLCDQVHQCPNCSDE